MSKKFDSLIDATWCIDSETGDRVLMNNRTNEEMGRWYVDPILLVEKSEWRMPDKVLVAIFVFKIAYDLTKDVLMGVWK